MKMDKTELKIALYLMPFFTLAVGFKWPLLGLAVTGSRYLFLVLSLILAIKSKQLFTLIKDESFCILLLIYFVLIISTTINDESMDNAIQLAVYGIMPYLVMCRYWRGENGNKKVLGGINLAFTILILANFIIMLRYPNGIYSTYSSNTVTKYYLFGAKNQMVAPVLVGMGFFVEHAIDKYGKLNLWTTIKCLICICELILGGSGTGIIMIASFVILEVLQRKKQLISTNTSYVALIVMFVGVVLFQMQNIFSVFIENVLHKSLTLSNRTYIWEAAILSIKQHPIIGIGVSDTLAGKVLLKLDYISKDTFAHNTYLDFAVMGGVIAIAFFIIFLLRVKHNYDSTWCHKYNSIIWWGLWLYLVAAILEIYPGNYCLYLITAYIATKYHNRRLIHEGS